MIGTKRPGSAAGANSRLYFRLVTALAAMLLLSGCAIARDVLYRPLAQSETPPVWVHGAPSDVVVTSSDELSIHGYFWPGSPDDPDIFVFFHGRHMNAQTGAKYAQHLLGRGDAVLVASYRGFGGNDGKPDEAGIMQDAAAFIAKARTLVGPNGRIWLVGHSLGSAVALQSAANDNDGDPAIKGVFAMSSFTRASAAAPRLLRILVPDKWDNLSALGAVHVPLFFFQGGQDHVIPRDSGVALMKAASPPALLLLGEQSPHNPDMTILGPWISSAAGLMADGGFAALPAPPQGWSVEERRP